MAVFRIANADILASQIANSGERGYGVGGENDVGGIIL